MPHIDYWLDLMRQLADEVRSLSEPSRDAPREQRMQCEKCGYLRIAAGSARQYCPNGCGELRPESAPES
jgi:hypothetical protein